MLVFATNNPHKAQEVEQILNGRYSIKTLKDIGCTTDIEETENTLEGNALLKARYVRQHFGLDCFSEDTGLEVDALGGAPGVHTARYAGEGRKASDNIALLLRNLEGVPAAQRTARFRTIIALLKDGEEHLFEGICNGRIAEAPTGEGGFGYDPVFIPEGFETTFAQMTDADKNRISHRGKATELLKAFLLLI